MDRREAHCGVMQADDEFPQALNEQVGEWRSAHPGLDVLMSGMVGSKQGWAGAGVERLNAPIPGLGVIRNAIECNKAAPVIWNAV
jgi:2-keto-3-deoxy-galactonokinase